MKIIGLSLIFLVSSEFGDAQIFNNSVNSFIPDYDYAFNGSEFPKCEKRVSDKVQVYWVGEGQLKRVSEFDSSPNITELRWVPDSSSKIRVIRCNSFSSLKHLQTLHLNDHGITYIEPGAFNGLTELTELALNNNNISVCGIFDGLSKLNSLSLNKAFNHYWTKLPVGIFKNLSQLTDLSLAENNFEHIPMGIFDNLTSLQYLRLNSNNITTIKPGTFGNLKLDLLDLSNNKIKVIETNTFNGVSALRLYLKKNSIEEIKPRAFNGSKTEVLNLEFNQLTTIGPDDFHGLNTEILALGGNDRMEMIANGAFKNAVLKEVDFHRNPINTTVPEMGLPQSAHPLFTIE